MSCDKNVMAKFKLKRIPLVPSYVLFYSQWFLSVLICVHDNCNFVIKKLRKENNNLENVAEKKIAIGRKNFRHNKDMRKTIHDENELA